MKQNYTLKLEGKEWEECLDKTFKNKRRDVKVDGFRKGQVPKDVYLKKFGIESLFMDSVDDAVDILYKRLMEDDKAITPAATPSIDIKGIDANYIEVIFTLVGSPEVKIGKYKDLGIKKEKIEVSKEEIEHELSHIKEQFVDVKELEDKEKIKEGHVAVIDFEGFLNDKAFKGGKGEDYSLTIGSHTFIPGFEEGLVGLKKGDKKDLVVTFPENYQSEELKGKEVTFKVEVKGVKERIYPKFDEDFFKDLGVGGVSNLKELENYIKENIEAEKSKRIDDEFLFKCLDKVNETSKYEIPEEMTEDEVNRLTKEFSEKLSMQGLKLADYLKFSGSDMDKFKESLKEEANKRIGYRVLLDEVVKKEKLEISDKELEDALEKTAKDYNTSKEEFVKQIGSKDLFRYDLLMRKAMEIITGENNK